MTCAAVLTSNALHTMAADQAQETQHRSRKAQGAMGRALSQIKDMILNGELNPGEQIRQEEMALKLAVSRVPLREALNVLADQGLLYHRPHQGYFVTKRDPGQYAQIRRMLHLLENELMATIAWPGPNDLDRLRDLNAQMQRCVDAADTQQLIELNQQFHFAIFGLSPNRLIMDEVVRLWTLIEPGMWDKFDTHTQRLQTLMEHASLIEALAEQDRAACVAQMEQHRYSPEAGMPLELPGVVIEPRPRA
jgi:DNA-binding GntR family transcriptional regulator